MEYVLDCAFAIGCTWLAMVCFLKIRLHLTGKI